MRVPPPLILALGCALLAGCQARMSVEEARAVCRQEGGMLTVFTEQRVTQSGLGPIKESPGDCIHRDAYGQPLAPPAGPAPEGGTGR